MIIYKKILGFIISCVFIGLLEITYYNPGFFLYAIAISLALLLFYFWRIKNRFVSKREIFSYFSISFIFLLSLWCSFVVLDSGIIRNFVSVFSLYLFIMLFDSIFKKIYENKEISNEIIRNMDFLCFLFFTIFIFSVLIFIGINIFISIVFVFLYSLAIFYLKMYWNKVNIEKQKFTIILIPLLFSELYFCLALLPYNIYFLTFILWICYYIVSDFVIDEIKKEFVMKKKTRFLVICLVFILLSFLTIIKY